MVQKTRQQLRGRRIMVCGCWIRDEDDVAAFRCGDKSQSKATTYLCDNCYKRDAEVLGDEQ